MTGRTDLFGEIHEDEIVKIAREAAEKRGYAIWTDFEEYIERRKREERLKLSGWGIRQIKYEIKETLLAARWTPSKVRREARLYPPGTEPPENQRKKNQLTLLNGEGY